MKKLIAVLMLLFFSGAMVMPALADIPKATKIHKHHHHHKKNPQVSNGTNNGSAPAGVSGK